MKRLYLLAAALALTVPLLSASPFRVRAQSDDSAALQGMSVSVSTANMSALTGDSFTFTSVVTNSGAEATPPLVANLNFVSLDGQTFIDPEDWSHERTLALGPVTANSSAEQTWTVEPVLAGEIGIYVVVLPASYETATLGPPATSPAIHLSVTERRSLNPGGVLPVVLAVPGVLGLVGLGLQKLRRPV